MIGPGSNELSTPESVCSRCSTNLLQSSTRRSIAEVPHSTILHYIPLKIPYCCPHRKRKSRQRIVTLVCTNSSCAVHLLLLGGQFPVSVPVAQRAPNFFSFLCDVRLKNYCVVAINAGTNELTLYRELRLLPHH